MHDDIYHPNDPNYKIKHMSSHKKADFGKIIHFVLEDINKSKAKKSNRK